MDENKIIEFYKSHTVGSTMKEFHIGYVKLNKLLAKYGIEKHTHISSAAFMKETKQAKYGNPNYNNMEKNFETRINKYGSVNYYNISKCKETKYKNHGDENYNNITKCQQTKELRYGDKNYNNYLKNEETKLSRYNDAFYNNRDAAKSTCLEKYGVEYTTQIPAVRVKRKATCLEKYNVPYTCLLPSCKVKGNNSKPNKDFEDLLIKNNLVINEDYIREFTIEDKSYDFKLIKYNLLIEINPTATHNITTSVYKTEPKGYNYHVDKRQLANKFGYTCICI